MNSSHSSLDWVLSYWPHFAVLRFICVYVCVFYVYFFMTVLYYTRWGGPDGML